MVFLLAALALLQDPGESVSFTTVEKAPSSGFVAPQEMFVGSLKEWTDTWTTRLGANAPKRLHPSIDFDHDVVLVVALGMKNTGGYSVEITRIVRTKTDIQVFVKRTAPPEGSKASGGPTSPFVLARMKKPDRPVTFRDEDKK